MNRKIIYLLIGSLLACLTIKASIIDETIKLKVGPNDGLYQIVPKGDQGSVLSLDDNGLLGFVSVKPQSGSMSYYNSTFWRIHIDSYNQGQAPLFNFTNNKYGYELGISLNGEWVNLEHQKPSSQLEIGGSINGWAFSSTYADGVETAQPLYSYFKPDSVVTLKIDGNKLVAVKLGANELRAVANSDQNYLFSLKKPDNVTLSATDLNTMLGTNPEGKSFKLKFDKEIDSNVFANELTARDTILSIISNTPINYVTLTNTLTGKYLRADTAYIGESNFIQITDTASAETYELSTNTTLKNILKSNNYAFRFDYSPATDSVFISVWGTVLKQETNKFWSNSYLSTEATDDEKLHLCMKELGTSNILTIGEEYADVCLGFHDIKVITTRTTIPDNLYVIKSTDGQYLGVPLDGDTVVKWVTLDENVDIWAMPSFQWVGEKNQKDSEISPVRFTNREFGDWVKVFNNVNIDKTIQSRFVDQKGQNRGISPEGFIPATNAIRANSYLGYKYLEADEMQSTQYKFRNLQASSDEYYIGLNATDNDPNLYIGPGSAFVLQQDGDQMEEYGYTTDAIPDLKPLSRKIYTLKAYNAKQIAGQPTANVAFDNSKGQFIISESEAPAKFLLKASNKKVIDGVETPFYTFIKIGTNKGDTVKIGIDTDQHLIGQDLAEASTSTFSIEEFKFEAALSPKTPAANGWYTTPVTLTAPGGYTIALKNNPDYARSIVWDTDGTNDLTYSLKPDGAGETIEKTISLKLDLVDPTISVSVNYLDYTLNLSDQENGSGIDRLYIDGREVTINTESSSYNGTASAGTHTALLVDGAGRTTTVSFTLREPIVYYSITLPKVEGATTSPAAGSHRVESWYNFEFSLTLDEGYRLNSEPVVKANGTVITPRASDGKYVIKDVQQDMEVEIEGIVKDSDVANEEIDNDIHIYSANRTIYIDLPRPLSCRLTDLSGRTIRSLELSSGQNRMDGLATGAYIINLGDRPGIKVICKD